MGKVTFILPFTFAPHKVPTEFLGPGSGWWRAFAHGCRVLGGNGVGLEVHCIITWIRIGIIDEGSCWCMLFFVGGGNVRLVLSFPCVSPSQFSSCRTFLILLFLQTSYMYQIDTIPGWFVFFFFFFFFTLRSTLDWLGQFFFRSWIQAAIASGVSKRGALAGTTPSGIDFLNTNRHELGWLYTKATYLFFLGAPWMVSKWSCKSCRIPTKSEHSVHATWPDRCCSNALAVL
jgi:hypothetical protein